MKKIRFLIFLFIGLFFSVLIANNQTSTYLTPKGEGVEANIIVDPSLQLGDISPIWQVLAQGGEEKFPFKTVQKEIADLKPKYIRIDHIYDFYEVVEKKGNQLVFNWDQLDQMVDSIVKIGALPFLCLSYMPPAIAQNGDIVNPPRNWQDWTTVVKETIQHFSGQNNLNLKNVIYEVWNEPDLFGNWRIGGNKDYRLLYRYAIIGANQTENTNPFKIGRPAITAPYLSWVDGFLNYIVQNNLRLDFYSWHRYSLNPKTFLEDINKVDPWIFQNAGYHLEKYLTEWGAISENSFHNDTNFAAAHMVATIRQLLQRVDFAFNFEIKDGPSPKEEKYWGGAGLLTHEKAGQIEKKPKYFALQMLNEMKGKQISLSGEGTWVTGFAVKENEEIKIILVNFDPNQKNFENVPLTIINLENGIYSYQENYLPPQPSISLNVSIWKNLKKQIPLAANHIVMIKLRKL